MKTLLEILESESNQMLHEEIDSLNAAINSLKAERKAIELMPEYMVCITCNVDDKKEALILINEAIEEMTSKKNDLLSEIYEPEYDY